MLPGCMVGDNMINAKQVYINLKDTDQHGALSFDDVSEMDSAHPQHGIRFLIPKDARMDGLE